MPEDRKFRGKLFVISGPSGVGKNTLVREVLASLPQTERIITATTRQPREGEKEGKDYYFLSRDEFEKRKKGGYFLEWASIYGFTYGTPKDLVDQKLAAGKNVILAVDVQGALQVKKKRREAVLIFIMPPSLSDLEKRLRERKTEDARDIKIRLQRAKEEIKLAQQYDYVIVNRDVKQAVSELLSIMKSKIKIR